MIKIRFADGSEYSAGNAKQLIKRLQLEDYQEGDYKNNVKSRVKLWNGEEISFDTDIEFLRELERVGVVVIEPPN